MASRVLALIIVGAMLAGCAAPAATRDDQAAGADAALPRSLDVDLHEYLLNITMKADEPTMLVALAVTEDMWGHPTVGVYNEDSRHEVASSWVLCPWLDRQGLLPDDQAQVLFFWLNGTVLEAATRAPLRRGFVGGSWDGGYCGAGTTTDYSESWIATHTPHAGTLVAIATTIPGDAAGPFPEWSLQLGLATPCGSGTWCPPDEMKNVEPLERGGPRVVRELHAWGPDCADCGFVVDDRTQQVDAPAICATTGRQPCAVWTGTLSVEAVPRSTTGLVRVDGFYNGPSAVMTSISQDAANLQIECRDPSFGFTTGFADAGSQPTLSVDLTLHSAVVWGVIVQETPIDLAAHGWSVTPSLAGYTLVSPYAQEARQCS